MKYDCPCGAVLLTADNFSAHVQSCPKGMESMATAREFADRYTGRVMKMNLNEASCLAGMALTRCRHLGMTVEQLNQLVSLSVSTYEKEVGA